MKNRRIGLILAVWAVLSAGGSLVRAAAAELTLTAPLCRQVFQRDADDRAEVLVSGQINDGADVIEAKAELMSDAQRGTPVAWAAIAAKLDIEQGRFSGRLSLSAGGWYRLVVRARQGDRVVAEQAVEKVGVGEVFITAGQSNSANYGQPRQQAKDPRVVYFDGRDFVPAKDPIPGGCGGGGSPWSLVGDRIATSQQIPVCFRSASLTWTEVKNWLPPDTQLYKNLANCTKAFGANGVRAVLWHQGESDTLSKTPAEMYCERVQAIVETLSKDAGYRIPWFVSQASFHPGSREPEPAAEVASGQRLLWERKICLRGPNTDDLLGKEYRCDGVHFGQKGLEEHAARWFAAVSESYDWSNQPFSKADPEGDHRRGSPSASPIHGRR